MIWKMLMIAEKRFRRLKAPGLMRDVYLGTLYMDGMAIEAKIEVKDDKLEVFTIDGKTSKSRKEDSVSIVEQLEARGVDTGAGGGCRSK